MFSKIKRTIILSYIYVQLYIYISCIIISYLKRTKAEITWAPPDPRELETLRCWLGGPPFFIRGGTYALGLAKCCWWHVLTRGGPPSTLLKFSAQWGGAPQFIKGPHVTGEHQQSVYNTYMSGCDFNNLTT